MTNAVHRLHVNNSPRSLATALGTAVPVSVFALTASATEYRVGPGQPLLEIESVPRESLQTRSLGTGVRLNVRCSTYQSSFVQSLSAMGAIRLQRVRLRPIDLKIGAQFFA